MDLVDRITWLKQYTSLGVLSEPALAAIAANLTPVSLSANRRLVLEDTLPQKLYILRSGRLESYRTSNTGLARIVNLLPGSVLHLQEFVLDQPVQQTVVTLTDCELWEINRDRLLSLLQEYPEISRAVSRRMAAELSQISTQLAYEQERQSFLRPYLVPRVRRGIIGSSRYAVRLRQDIKKAANGRHPVLIFGEPGLEKDNIAALIHFGSSYKQEPMIRINCNSLQANGAELFGRLGGKPGLLQWLGSGTLLLNNVQDLPEQLQTAIAHLLSTGEYRPITADGDPPAPARPTSARIIMVAEKNLPHLLPPAAQVQVIKVPPLRVRKADLQNQVDYYLSLICRNRKLTKPTLTPEGLRSLQGYDFPGNLTELESLLKRAVVQANGSPELTEAVLWSEGSKTRRFRLNLLNAYPWLRRSLRSPWWPDRLNYGFTLTAFALVVAILWFGPQSRDQNVALNLFWAWWWPLVLVSFPFVGRLWCAVCPFMIYGDLTQKLSLWLWPRQLADWPRQAAERWGGWFLFGLFTLILLWEELWHLENTAYLSACLLLLITAGAVIFSLLFERRFWCRYLCPIGGMNGLFAKLAMIELRAQQGICSATCTTYQCYKGGPAKGEGQATGGCPVYSHPAQLEDNRNCVLCMTCLKACPHRSVELNLRPPGIELWTTHKPTAYEVALLFLLCGAVLLHRLPEGLAWLGLTSVVSLESVGVHFAVAVLALLIPVAVAWGCDRLMRLIHQFIHSGLKLRPFIELAYGYLPLVLAGNLAHYLDLGLTEAGRILPLTAITLGLPSLSLPVAIAHPAVVTFLQAVTLIVGTWVSVFFTQKIGRQSLGTLLPQHLATFAIGSIIWKLIVG